MNRSPLSALASMVAAAAGGVLSLGHGSPASRRGFKMISPIASSIRGKVGGLVFSRARGAEITGRSLAIPSNPNTLIQRDVRNAQISLSSRWRDVLTEEERELWWDLATGSQTGKGLYTTLNQPRAYGAANLDTDRTFKIGTDPAVALDIIDSPPAIRQFTDPFNVSYVVDDSANNVVVTVPAALVAALAGSETAPGLLLIFASHQQPASAFSRKHPLGMIASIFVTEDTEADTQVTIPLQALGFTTQVGKVMYFKAQLSTPLGAYAKTGEVRQTIVA
jgi:hypothetical protein